MRSVFASKLIALLLVAVGLTAEARGQSWIRQFGTSDAERAGAPALDGSGGVYVPGCTQHGVGLLSTTDAWLAR